MRILLIQSLWLLISLSHAYHNHGIVGRVTTPTTEESIAPTISTHRDSPFKPPLTQNGTVQKIAKTTRNQPCISLLVKIHHVNVADIAELLKDKTNALLSECGAIIVDERTNTLWLHGTDDRVKMIHSLIKQLDIPIKQVVIEARIVNMTKNRAKDIGIRFGISKSMPFNGTLPAGHEMTKGILPLNVPIADRLNVDLGALPLASSPASMGVALATLANGVLLDLELSALESEGRAEIIASPRLVTTDQQAAIIESGEDIPYQQSTLSGATAVAFKKAVLSLKVTPKITDNGHLLMDLQINQDADSGERVQGVPVILTKSIATKVWVKHGQTIVLGGIYKQDKNNSVTRVPFLGSLPMVGILFRRTEVKIKNEELLIFITPRIITNNLPPMINDRTRRRDGD